MSLSNRELSYSGMLAASVLVAAMLFCGRVNAGSVELPSEIGGAFSVKVKSIKDTLAAIRFRSTVRQNYDYSCGSAAVATLLTHHYGQPVSEEQVFRAMYAKGNQPKIQREGFSLLDMKLYLETRGFSADGFEATLEQVTKFGAPGIVLVQDNGYRHFVVLKGINGDKVLLGDPAVGSRVLSRKDFERLWVNHIFFVVHSHRDSAQFNVPGHWVLRPSATLGDAINRDSLAGVTLMRLNPITDF